MKKINFLLFLLVISTYSFGQMGFGKIEEVKEVKQRTLVFLMEEEDPDKIKKLTKKPEELLLYKSEIRRLNDAMKVAAGYWTYTASPVEFKTRTATRSSGNEKE